MSKWDNSGKIMTVRLLAVIGLVILVGLFRFLTGGSGEDVTTAASSTPAVYSEATAEGTTAVTTAATTEDTTAATTALTTAATTTETTTEPGITVTEDGTYTDKDHVALYIRTYGKLPSNYITKKAAEKLGWPGGDLYKYAEGKSIGGSVFGNNEGLLPEKEGRKYYECDIDYKGGSRNGKRIVYSNDGLIFYTDDHYESFTELDP